MTTLTPDALCERLRAMIERRPDVGDNDLFCPPMGLLRELVATIERLSAALEEGIGELAGCVDHSCTCVECNRLRAVCNRLRAALGKDASDV